MTGGNPWLQVGLAILGVFGAGGIGAAILNASMGADQRRADAAKTLTETATSTASELVAALRGELRTTREELDHRIDALEEQLTDQKRLFWSAIGYIRRLAATLDDDHPRPEIPQELREYL